MLHDIQQFFDVIAPLMSVVCLYCYNYKCLLFDIKPLPKQPMLEMTFISKFEIEEKKL